MLLASILARRDITPCDKLTLMVFDMESYGADQVAISHGAIAVKAGISRTQALASVARLAIKGLVKRSGTPIKQVQPYSLLYRAAKSKPSIVVKCARCHHEVRWVNKACWCRACVKAVKIEREVREARMVVGESASTQQIAAQVQFERIQREVQAAVRMRRSA